MCTNQEGRCSYSSEKYSMIQAHISSQCDKDGRYIILSCEIEKVLEQQYLTLSAQTIFMIFGNVSTLLRGTTPFFSQVHLSYSRIEMFLLDKFLLQKISLSEIGNITWTDHAPASITVGSHGLLDGRLIDGKMKYTYS